MTILLHRGCKITAMVDLCQTQRGFNSLSQTVFEIYTKKRFRNPYADKQSHPKAPFQNFTTFLLVFVYKLSNFSTASSLSCMVAETYSRKEGTLFVIHLSIYLSGTKPQGLFNSASFSHRRPHFNSYRQILRYSVLLGIHEKI